MENRLKPSDEEIKKALDAVALYGQVRYPVGADRSHLCHAAVILAAAWNNRAPAPSERVREVVEAIFDRLGYCPVCHDGSSDGPEYEGGGNGVLAHDDDCPLAKLAALSSPEGGKKPHPDNTCKDTEPCPQHPRPNPVKSYVCDSPAADHSQGPCPRCEVLR